MIQCFQYLRAAHFTVNAAPHKLISASVLSLHKIANLLILVMSSTYKPAAVNIIIFIHFIILFYFS